MAQQNGPMSVTTAPRPRTLQELHPEWFERKVRPDFYETEEMLGPLGPEWEKAYKGRQVYFVNHQEKITTWVDPRTSKTREHDITKIRPGELPYGWDEAVDAEIGVYYIDHNTQTTYLDPPWDDYVRYQVAQLAQFLQSQQNKVQDFERMAAMASAQTQSERMAEAERNISELEKRRAELERELIMFSNSVHKDPSKENEIEILTVDIDDLDERIRLERLLAAGDTRAIADEVARLKQRLAELAALNERLRSRGDEVAEAKAARREMERLRALLDKEAADRARLESEIMKLKYELDGADYNEQPEPIAPPKSVPMPDVIFDGKRRKTRYDMEIEILMLKKRLEAERAERDRLDAMKRDIDGIKSDNPNALPDWVKKTAKCCQQLTNTSSTDWPKARTKSRSLVFPRTHAFLRFGCCRTKSQRISAKSYCSACQAHIHCFTKRIQTLPP